MGAIIGFGNNSSTSSQVGPLLVVDTPNNLIERGRLEEGKGVLRIIRGIENVEPECLGC